MQNKNILELCLSPDAGGLELYMMRFSHFIAQKCSTISVLSSHSKLEQYYKDKPYKYEKIVRKKGLFSLVTAKKLANIIDENSIDVLHIHWTKDLLVAVLAKKISQQKPKIVQTRHMTMTRFKDDFYHKFLYKNLDLMIAVTQQVKEQIEKYIPEGIRPEVEKIYVGAKSVEAITQEQKLSYKEQYKLGNSFVIGMVARIERGKGQYLLIDALEMLLEKGLDVKVLLVGHAMDAQYLQELTKSIEARDMQEYVVFTGFSTEAQTLMQVCDTLVLATPKETLGLVLAEAMAVGVAVVASDSGGPLEVIENKKSGLLFQTLNAQDLAKKLEMLFDDSVRLRLADKAKERVSELFDEEKQFQAVFESLSTL